MVAPADPCLSPTKGELVYSKTAKQCLEEISGMHQVTTHVGSAWRIFLSVGVRMCRSICAL